jgi:hypothetical protein
MKSLFHPKRSVQFILGLAALAFTQCDNSNAEKARQMADMNDLHLLQMTLKMYAGDNSGKYPPALSELMPKYAHTDQFLEFTDRRTKQRTPWLYRSSLTETSPANEVLLAAPVASSDRKRVVGFNDGGVRVISEAEFQALWNRK